MLDALQPSHTSEKAPRETGPRPRAARSSRSDASSSAASVSVAASSAEPHTLLQPSFITPSASPAVSPRSSSRRPPANATSLSRLQTALLASTTHSRLRESLQLPGPSPITRARSTTSRRPPASHSSHGVANSLGPPPALITRNSLPEDSARDYISKYRPSSRSAKVDQYSDRGSRPGSASSNLPTRAIARRGSTTSESTTASNWRMSLHADRQSDVASDGPQSRSRKDNGYSGHVKGNGDLRERSKRDQSQSPSRSNNSRADDDNTITNGEDVFLNIAEDSPVRHNVADVIGARSRTTAHSHRPSFSSQPNPPDTNRPRSSGQPLTHSTSNAAPRSQGHQRRLTHPVQPAGDSRSTRDGPSTYSPITPSTYASHRSLHHSEHKHYLDMTSTNDERQHEQFQSRRRRTSITESTQTPLRNHAFRSSHLTHSHPQFNSSPPIVLYSEPASNGRADGSDSAESVTAPSSVWDELGDLKSRIRKLEFSGKMPSQPGASISNGSGERPRTATTTVTTISSSPRNNRKCLVASENAVGGPQYANIHPLLHSALAKAKPVLNPHLYKTLELTALDALQLAMLTGGAGLQSTAFNPASSVNGASVSDRQMRRKADNMCRSLTELCIALCDSQHGVSSPRTRLHVGTDDPSISDTETNGSTPHTARLAKRTESSETVHAPRQLKTPSLALSRIQARRSSVPASAMPQEVGSASHDETAASDAGHVRRSGTTLRRTRHSERDDDGASSTLRAPSRAFTELISERRRSLASSITSRQQKRASREYTSNHPLPDEQSSPTYHNLMKAATESAGSSQPSPSFRSRLPPTSSLLRAEARRRSLDRSTPPASPGDSPGDRLNIEERRRRISSMTQYSTPGHLPRRAVANVAVE